MFNFFNKQKKQSTTQQQSKLASGLKNILANFKTIDEKLFNELETLMITSDIGINTVERVIANIKKSYSNKQLNNIDDLYKAVQLELTNLLVTDNKLVITAAKPFVILVVGVNGSGKTTTIAKLTHKFNKQNKTVLLGAGDTFRAAAIEQLKIWGDRNNTPVVAGKTGGDSAAILFDALQSAKAKNIDILIADTSGRLHTHDNLMAELAKINRVLAKNDAVIPHEVLLVVDGTSGHNAIAQAKEFNKAVKISGIAITKLDGSAKGGFVFALSDELKLPIRYIGVGEAKEDLKEFVVEDFSRSIFK